MGCPVAAATRIVTGIAPPSPEADAATGALPRDPLVGRWTGHALQLFRDRFGFMQRAWASSADVLTVQYFDTPTHLVLSPAGVREVLVGKARAFSKATLGYRELERITGRGILTDDGASWRAHRGALQPFFTPARARAAAQRTEAVAAAALTHAWHRGHDADVFATMNELAMQLLLDHAFERPPVSDDARRPLSETLSVLLDIANRRIGTRPPVLNRLRRISALRFEIARGRVDALVDALLGNGDGNGGRGGLVQALLAFCADPGRARDEVRTLLLAGHETTATALTWTLALLAREPSWQDAIAAGDDASPALAAVLQESLRLYPPIWSISRRTTEAVDIQGTAIAADRTVIVSPYLVQRHPRWFPDPDRFDPTRFLDGSAPADALFPFGAGQRLCIGRSLAMMQLRRIVWWTCRHYRLSARPDEPMPPPEATITLRPARKVRLRVTPR